LRVLADLDDYFLAASESGHEVSKMLEANRLHYHSNFADNKGSLIFPLFFSTTALIPNVMAGFNFTSIYFDKLRQ
jgi:hypothetical protein